MMTDDSRPPSPTSKTWTPSSRSGNGSNYFSVPFERFRRDDMSEWTSAFTLLDTIETFFDSRLDLLERRFKKHSDRLKLKAEEAFKISSNTDLLLGKDIDREIQKYRLKFQTRLARLATTWQSTKVVRTREKISFFFGVMSVLASSLIFGLAPEWMHISYTIQALYFLPMRAYTYKKKAWHYFLFDLCYYTTILNFIYIWLFPANTVLWIACYCLSHGSLASAVITWRNSLVFHDQDKIVSLFIHIYAPLTFTVIRHFYKDAGERFPAVAATPHLNYLKAFGISGLIYVIWQALYWKFVIIDRRKKIESGQRTTSFSWLLNDKRGVIGRTLGRVPTQYREVSFMTGQLAFSALYTVYALLTEAPAILLLYDSAFWSGAFLIFIFGVSAWNGGGFYIEVFGRKFERELEALRKELAESSASRSSASNSVNTSPTLAPHPDDDELSAVSDSPYLVPTELHAPDGSILPPSAKPPATMVPTKDIPNPQSLGLDLGPEAKKDQ